MRFSKATLRAHIDATIAELRGEFRQLTRQEYDDETGYAQVPLDPGAPFSERCNAKASLTVHGRIQALEDLADDFNL